MAWPLSLGGGGRLSINTMELRKMAIETLRKAEEQNSPNVHKMIFIVFYNALDKTRKGKNPKGLSFNSTQ